MATPSSHAQTLFSTPALPEFTESPEQTHRFVHMEALRGGGISQLINYPRSTVLTELGFGAELLVSRPMSLRDMRLQWEMVVLIFGNWA